MAFFVAFTNVEVAVKATGYPAGGDPTRAATAKARLQPSYPYKFEAVSDVPYQVIETEVLVIGSGAGGGVVSSQLAIKGHKVLVVDKGMYIPAEQLSGTSFFTFRSCRIATDSSIGTPAAGFRDLYENNGLMASEDGSINILAGSTFGGGTTVNWSASLIPQHFVRQEWATKNKLPHFLTKEFTDSIDFVCHRMGVSPAAVVHSKPNALLVDASTKLGYHASTIPQNTAGNQHSCGFCSFGCEFSISTLLPIDVDVGYQ